AHAVARDGLEGLAALLDDGLGLGVGQAHEQALAEKAREHVAVYERGEVSEHRPQRYRGLGGDYRAESFLRRLAGLGHLHAGLGHGSNVASWRRSLSPSRSDRSGALRVRSTG